MGSTWACDFRNLSDQGCFSYWYSMVHCSVKSSWLFTSLKIGDLVAWLLVRWGGGNEQASNWFCADDVVSYCKVLAWYLPVVVLSRRICQFLWSLLYSEWRQTAEYMSLFRPRGVCPRNYTCSPLDYIYVSGTFYCHQSIGTWVSLLLFQDFSSQSLCTFLDLTRVPDTCTSFDPSP